MSGERTVPHRLREDLLPVLEDFATYGGVHLNSEMGGWLQDVGVAEPIRPGGWLVPSYDWIKDVLPAGNSLELLRRTLLLLPSYRTHLDVVLCAVLHAVGASERWTRFEELLFGAYAPFAQRFAALLEWQEMDTGLQTVKLGQNAWQEADRKISAHLFDTFPLWDQELWGASGNPNLLFPLLGDLYLPLVESPVYLSAETAELYDGTTGIIAALISAARNGDGVLFRTEKGKDAFARLIPLGFPVRLFPSPTSPGYSVLGLTGRVILRGPETYGISDLSTAPIPQGLPSPGQRSEICSGPAEMDRHSSGGFWDVAEGQAAINTFISIDRRLDRWPMTSPADVPPWSQLPSMEPLSALGKPRKGSPEADEALLMLGNHALYGFLVQLLLLEALDRELGEETLVLAPPIDRKVQDLEGATVVVYRCRLLATLPDKSSWRPSYELGSLDLVLDRVAREIGIQRVCRPYMEEDAGPWSRSLKILRTAQIVVARHDRWCMAPEMLDRLHGGGLMTQIIRRGRSIRERLHTFLEALWMEKHSVVDKGIMNGKESQDSSSKTSVLV